MKRIKGKDHKLFITHSDYCRFLKTAAGSSSKGIIQLIDPMAFGLYHSEKQSMRKRLAVYSVIKNTEEFFFTGLETFKAISWFLPAVFIFL